MAHERYSAPVTMPQAPRNAAPAGACDCHGHIFAAPDRYPIADASMPLSPVDLYLDVHDRMGTPRGVLVQGGAYRHDNRAMLDALDQHPDRLRGVALVAPDIAEADLAAMRARGVRALRFTRGGASKIGELPALASRMRAVGMHAELYIGTAELMSRARELFALGIPLVLDHLAGPYAGPASPDDDGFKFMLQALKSEDIWVKLSPQRNAEQFPSYADARGCFDAIVAARPARLVWGSDWPFPHMGDKTPSPSDLLDLFFDWTGDAALQKRILVDNPVKLYGFAPV